MSLLEPLSTVIAAIDRAADEIAQGIHGTITANDPSGFEQQTRLVRRLLDLRIGAQAIVGELSVTNTDCGDGPAIKGKEAPPVEGTYEEFCQLEFISDEVVEDAQVEFTPAEVYGRFVLLGFVLLGGTARYRDAQKVMLDLMKFESLLKPADLTCTAGTTRPRVLAQSSSHRLTMVRRKLLVSAGGGADAITDIGRAQLSAWMESTGRECFWYTLELDSALVDLYYHAANYLMALFLLGGRATDAEVVRVSERLQTRFPILRRKLEMVDSRFLSPTHLETFRKEKLVKAYANGEVVLTGGGENAALAQLHGCGIPEKLLRRGLPRRRQP